MTTLAANVMTSMLSNVSNIAVNLVSAALKIAKSIIIASGGNSEHEGLLLEVSLGQAIG